MQRRTHLTRGSSRRVQIYPPLSLSFDEVYLAVSKQPGKRTPKLETTGDVVFEAETKLTRDGRRFISLPHNNRIYEDDWGYMANSMGRDGQRIGHYSVPLDKWARKATADQREEPTLG